MKAKMNQTVKLLGTSLVLNEGQSVTLTPANNLPQGGFFAAPADGSWGEDSVHVDYSDIAWKLPTIKEITRLVQAVKGCIDDDCQAYEFADEDTPPGIQITIGFTPESGSWDYQTGDNSFTGGAYGHAFWGVGYVFRNSNCREVAKEILADLESVLF